MKWSFRNSTPNGMKERIKLAIVVLLSFFLARFLYRNTGTLLDGFISDTEANYAVRMFLFFVILPAIITMALHKSENPLKELGLRHGFWKALVISFLICLPMLMGYLFLFQLNHELTFGQLMAYCAMASLGEEILFRGFLFGQLFRHAKWGIVLAEFVEALLFGLMHLYQAHDVPQAIGIFAVTFFGGLWFAWLYVEWNFNLWVPIGVHCLMNAYWYIFGVSHNALGGTAANIFRLITILLSIYLTIRYSKKRNEKMVINWSNLIVNRGSINRLFSKVGNGLQQPVYLTPNSYILTSLFYFLC